MAGQIEIEVDAPNKWNETEMFCKVLLGTPYSVRCNLVRDWHVCRNGKDLGGKEYARLSEAKAACEVKAAYYLR